MSLEGWHAPQDQVTEGTRPCAHSVSQGLARGSRRCDGSAEQGPRGVVIRVLCTAEWVQTWEGTRGQGFRVTDAHAAKITQKAGQCSQTVTLTSGRSPRTHGFIHPVFVEDFTVPGTAQAWGQQARGLSSALSPEGSGEWVP